MKNTVYSLGSSRKLKCVKVSFSINICILLSYKCKNITIKLDQL